MGPNYTRGGFQNPRINRGGPGNPGTTNNMEQRTYRPASPYFGSGQRPDLGRYVPPTMRDGNNWNDRGGYAYNLPNSYGPRPDFGEFNSPYAQVPRYGAPGNTRGGRGGGGTRPMGWRGWNGGRAMRNPFTGDDLITDATRRREALQQELNDFNRTGGLQAEPTTQTVMGPGGPIQVQSGMYPGAQPVNPPLPLINEDMLPGFRNQDEFDRWTYSSIRPEWWGNVQRP